jgi:hypothetical protein
MKDLAELYKARSENFMWVRFEGFLENRHYPENRVSVEVVRKLTERSRFETPSNSAQNDMSFKFI